MPNDDKIPLSYFNEYAGSSIDLFHAFISGLSKNSIEAIRVVEATKYYGYVGGVVGVAAAYNEEGSVAALKATGSFAVGYQTSAATFSALGV